MTSEALDLDTDSPAIVLRTKRSIGFVWVRKGLVDPVTMRDGALALMKTDLAEGESPARWGEGVARVRKIGGKRVSGLQLATDPGEERWNAEAYATALGARTVLLLFVYPERDEALHTKAIERVASTLALDQSA
jgi:hypothetical protein